MSTPVTVTEIANLIEREFFYDSSDPFPSGQALAETLLRSFAVTHRPEVGALPTEDGYYVGFDKLNDAPILTVARDGVVFLPDASKTGGIGNKLGDPERFLPFERLLAG